MIDHAQIAGLLDESRHAHQAYRDNVPRRVAAGPEKTAAVKGNAAAADRALFAACRARVEAHALDPALEAPAWQDEAVTHDHDALLDFYVQQLMR